MGKLKLYTILSMDGYSARTNGDIDFILQYTNNNDYGFNDFLQAMDAVLCNHQYYNELQSHNLDWLYADVPCYVLTDTLFRIPKDKNLQILLCQENNTDQYLEQIQELQKVYSNICLLGNRELITYCLKHDLIDELILVTLPLCIGHGSPFTLSYSKETHWEIIESKCFDNGVSKVHYRKKK